MALIEQKEHLCISAAEHLRALDSLNHTEA